MSTCLTLRRAFYIPRQALHRSAQVFFVVAVRGAAALFARATKLVFVLLHTLKIE